jgi:type II secretory pathway component PulJ
MATLAEQARFISILKNNRIKWYFRLVKENFMLRSNKGYLLMESMLSLLLFSAIASICLPYISVLHQEQKTTEQLLYAIEEADRFSVNKIQVGDKEWARNGARYRLSTEKGVTDEYKVCIQFQAANQKEYTVCSSYY